MVLACFLNTFGIQWLEQAAPDAAFSLQANWQGIIT